MCGLCLPTETGNDIHDKVTLNDIILTDEYADVIVTETELTNKPIDHDANMDKGEVVLVGMEFPDGMRLLNDPNIWIGDTAASGHTSLYQHGMTPEGNTVKNGSITVGNRFTEKTVMYKNISGTVCNKQGAKVGRAKLMLVAYSPNMKFNLCPLSKLCQDGWEMKGNKEFLVMEKNNQKMNFDIKVTTATCVVYCIYLQRDEEIANAAVEYSINQAHERLGHSHEDATGNKIEEGGYETAKQKNLTKVSEHKKWNTPGERMFLDLASFKPPKKGLAIPKPNWRSMVDEFTNFKITHFFKKKDEVVESTCELIKQLKDKNLEIKFLRMDNTGENQLLEARCKSKDWQFGFEFEYTARATPQHNHMAELGVAALVNKGRALMFKANIPEKYRYYFFREAFCTATDLDGLVFIEVSGKKATRFFTCMARTLSWRST
jgi:hypothetical protein